MSRYKSKYYTESHVDGILDKISKRGLDNLSITDKNILRVSTEGDYEIDLFIERLNKLSTQCHKYIKLMDTNEDTSLEGNKEYLDKWTDCCRKMSLIEHTLDSMYSLSRNDYSLDIDKKPLV